MNDCDWMAAESLKSAIDEYMANHAGGLPEDEAVEDARELSPDEMRKLVYVDEPGDVRRSFREHLDKLIADGHKFPCFFASTEY